jgi:hypothetical protein
MADFIVEMKKASTVYYLLVAGASSQVAAMEIARRYSVAFGAPSSAKLVCADSSEPEPSISLYITGEIRRATTGSRRRTFAQ